MKILINYNNNSNKKNLSNKLFFVDEGLNIRSLKKFITTKEYLYVTDLFKNTDNKKKISIFELSSSQSIILIKLERNIKNYEIENLGGDFFNFIKKLNKKEFVIDSDAISIKIENLIGYFLHGIKLKSYKFDK